MAIAPTSPPVAQGSVGPRAPLADLGALAAVARRALGADALVIATRSAGGRSIAAAEGLAGDYLDEIDGALVELEPQLLAGPTLSLPWLAAPGRPGVKALVRLGFAAALGAGLDSDGERVGTIYALKRTDGPFKDEGLIAAFARHAAIAVAQRGMRPSAPPEVEAGRGLEALDQLSFATGDFEELLAALTARIGPFFDGAMTGVMAWDQQREILQLLPGSFGASEELAASYQIPALNARSNAARVFTTGRAYLSNAASGDPGILQDYVDAFHIERLVSVPLTLPGRSIGVLHLANSARDFTLEDVERARGLAPHVATAVEIATALFGLRRQLRLEGILSNVAVAIASGENVQDFLSPALEQLCSATGASLLALVAEHAPPLVCRRQTGDAALERIVLAEAAEMPGMRAYVVGPRQAGDPGWAAFHAPVRLGPQRIGTLAALRVRGEPFSQHERDAFTRLAGLAAFAWTSERYQQQRAELARLQERQRIADDLHDDVAQILFGAQLQLDAILEREGTERDVRAAIARARGLLIRGDTAIREVIHHLSRPTPADLAQRLITVVSGVETEFSLPIHLEISGEAAAAGKRLGKAATEALLKVARESLVNAAKHAGPCRGLVTLTISRRGRLQLTVVDDGVGIAEGDSARHHGLGSLRRAVLEHGGALRVRHGTTGGTKITASVPL